MAKRRTSMFGIPDPSLTVERRPLSSLDLHGRRAVVVGGTDGLGRAIARALASQGAEVTVVGRTFRDEGVPRITFVRADLASMREAARVGRELPVEGLELVVLTTGILAAKQREETAEGVERDLAVSYLSRFALVRALAPRLERGRIFVMGYPGAGELGDPADLNALGPYDGMKAHMNTVAANEALVLDAAERYPHLRVYGLNPGLVKTNIRANYFGEGTLFHRWSEFVIGLLFPSADTYAARVVPTLVAPELEARSGAMFGSKGHPILPTDGFTRERARAFVEASEELLARAIATG